MNYSIGARVAHRFLSPDGGQVPGPLGAVRQTEARATQAHAFFVKHGGKAVMLAQFVPIVRTFLPFVAGGADMPYRTFLAYNAIGAVAWVGICTGAGYLFGNIPVVKENFELVVLGIVGVSVLPIVDRVAEDARPPGGGARALTAPRSAARPGLGVDQRPHHLAHPRRQLAHQRPGMGSRGPWSSRSARARSGARLPGAS